MQELPISDALKNSINGSYLKRCILCTLDVIEANVPYAIEKVIKRHPQFKSEETLFEYCLCKSCSEEAWFSLSEESKQSITAFFQQHQGNLLANIQRATQAMDLQACFEHCVFTDLKKEDTQTYQLIAQCRGTNVLVHQGAFMISDEATVLISQLISPKTQEYLDDFIDNNFGLPPEFKDLFKDNPMLIL